MSSPPPFGPSGSGANKAKAKAKAKSSGPSDLRVPGPAARQVGAKSGRSSSEDDRQAARPRHSLSSISTESAGPSRGMASYSHLDPNVLIEPPAGLSINTNGSTIPMDQLPLWAKPLSRLDPVTGRVIPPRPRQSFPPSSTNANPATTTQPSAALVSHQDKDAIWYMMVTPASSHGPRRIRLHKWDLPPLNPNTAAEENRRIETLQSLRAMVRNLRGGGGPPYHYTGSYHPNDKRRVEHVLGWVLSADDVNRHLPDLATTTVWVNPFRSDKLYLTLALLFVDLYILAIPDEE